VLLELILIIANMPSPILSEERRPDLHPALLAR
jgi:hypothetical protein